MATVAQLSDLYANFMVRPQRGPNVCALCFNLTDGYQRCYACARGQRRLAAMVPISYSVAGEQLHHALVSYKRLTGLVARRSALGLAAVLWRFLAGHERCLARAARVDAFEVVTTVPAGQAGVPHPLHDLVASLVGPARGRYEPLLRRSETRVEPHRFDPEKYTCTRELDGGALLLIDDTWTTGANAHSAAAALRSAGSGPVAAVVIGRHVNRGWRQNDRHLRALPGPFDWSRCALCAPAENARPAGRTDAAPG